MSDPFNLQRFVDAQEGVYGTALGEIGRGAKRSHWMWYIFPQIAGLGRSQMSQRYAISSLDQARAYLKHPVLGPRLRECIGALQDLDETNVVKVFGEVDAMKLQSSLTLFVEASDDRIFAAALLRWFGAPDPNTLKLLRQAYPSPL